MIKNVSLFASVFVFCSNLLAYEFDVIADFVVPTNFIFQKSKVGGLSGITFDAVSGHYFVVSDDRGNINEPRLYELKIDLESKTFKPEFINTIYLKSNTSNLSHKTELKSAKIFSKVIDLEAITLTPWGDFLISNEGDQNSKPRISPQIFSITKEGIIQKDYLIPNDFIAESQGKQKKGLANNLAFEGLAFSESKKIWIAAAEGPLVQDRIEKQNSVQVRFLQFNLKDAWSIVPGNEFKYQLDKSPEEMQRGVSEVMFIENTDLWVMERSVSLTSQGPKFKTEIFQVTIPENSSESILKKTKVVEISALKDLYSFENFEGMCLGPKFKDGSQSLILVSDNNLGPLLKTRFVLIKIRKKS